MVPAASKYLRICNLAQGGMGTVDLVVRREGEFARVYAMKRLLPSLASDADLRAMFLDEARIAGLIRHANVVSVLDVGEDESGPYLVMDYVEGVSISAMLKGLAERRERVPMQVLLAIGAQMADGLHAAHQLIGPGGKAMHVIHRDVSPQNVLVGSDGCVRVTDFGVARALGRSTQTSTGILKGKFGYMTPEQLRFEEVDARSDLFSFGVVLHEMIVGHRLYSGEQSEVFRRIQSEPPPDAGEEREDVPDELIALLFELLAKDRARRPSDARVVARRLEAILRDVSADIGAVNLAEFVGERFEDDCVKQRALIAMALDASRALDAPTEHHEQPGMHEQSTRILGARTEPVVHDATTSVHVPGKRRGMIVWLGLAALAGVLATVAAALAIGARDDEAAPPPVLSAPSNVAPPEPVVPVVEEAPPAPVVAPPVAEPEVEEPTVPRRRARRGRPSRSGVPVWDDY